MFPTEIFRTAPFRLAVALAAALGAVALLLFGFIYWQMETFETQRVDTLLEREAAILGEQGRAEIVNTVNRQFAGGLFRVAFTALFAPDGTPLAGNMAAMPAALPIDGMAHRVNADALQSNAPGFAVVRAVGRKLPDGTTLVIGRDIAVLKELRIPVLHALELALLPAFLLSLGAGALLSRRALRRVKDMHETIERIMHGDLEERLPSRGTRDDLDRLVASVNRMLEQIERLLHETKAVGDNIAHDLRTPLARARTRLERGRNAAKDLAALQAVVDTVVLDLDQTIGIIRALLRIGEIESGRRRSGFGKVDLADLARQVYDLYQPLCEERGLALSLEISATPTVFGDGELLIEALANLTDNAAKFTPRGGQVKLVVASEGTNATIRVEDTGHGIPPAEREMVLRRFYRVAAARRIEGHGLGLSIVGAIIRLHCFRLVLRDRPDGTGSVFEVAAPALPAPLAATGAGPLPIGAETAAARPQ